MTNATVKPATDPVANTTDCELPGGGSGARMHEVRSAAVDGTADNGDTTCDTGTGGGLC